MNMNSKIKIKFGTFQNGWLPIAISSAGFTLEIDASDVPVDPVLQLIAAIENCFIRNQDSEAWMHLEPNYYKWVFSSKAKLVELKIFYVEEVKSLIIPGNYENREKLELQYESEPNELLFTIWRSLKEFTSRAPEYVDSLLCIEERVNELKHNIESN